MRWLLIALVCLLALALATLVWWLRRRRVSPRRQPTGPVPVYPVLLVHGICGFDELRLFGWKRRYFLGIAQHLEAMGIAVHHARLPPLASVPVRARHLTQLLDAIAAPRINVIAHSMGGLDARYAIAKLGAAGKIASLVTIGTPHHGTPLADLGQGGLAEAARGLARRFGLGSDSLDWLTPARMRSFNAEIADDPRVAYASVVCRAQPAALWRTNPLLAAPHAYVQQRAGSNDGMVPTSSQRWGRTLCELEADHWAQIGWLSSHDARPMYAMIVSDLASQGL